MEVFVSIFALCSLARSTHALPVSVPSGSALIMATDPLPTATGPTCVQTRAPTDSQSSEISAAIANDNSINKACNIETQQTTTINDGMLSVIYYGLDNQYFFNITHNINVVSRPIAPPTLCPNTFNAILSTCIANQNFWGGWIMTDGTNRSISGYKVLTKVHVLVTNFIYPDDPLADVGARSTGVSTVTPASGSQSFGAPSATTASFTGNVGTTARASSTAQMDVSMSGPFKPTDTSTHEVSGSITESILAESTVGASTVGDIDISSSTPAALSSVAASTDGSPVTGSPGTPVSASTAPAATEHVPATTQTFNTQAQGSATTVQASGAREPHPTVTQLAGNPSESVGTQQTNSQPPGTSAPWPSSIPLPPGGTVVYATISSRIYSETFLPTTLSGYGTLAGTITSSTLDSQSSPVPLVIGPGGVAWTPFRPSSREYPDLSPPAVLPTNPRAPHTTFRSELTASSVHQSSAAAASQSSSNTVVIPSQTPPPGTTQGGDASTGAPLLTITTSYDPEASIVTSIAPEITRNTAIRTSDDHHGLGLYPFWKGGPHCFIICPPGIDNGGIILWGMDKPGIYPPPFPPPFPGIEWPTITVNDDLEPTATEEPEDEPTNSKPKESTDSSAESTEKSTIQSTAMTTAEPSTSSVQSSSHTSTGSYTPATQKYILEVHTVGPDILKQRNSWIAKQRHLGGSSALTSSGSLVATTTGASSILGSGAEPTSTRPQPSSTRPPLTAAGTPVPTSQAALPTSYNPADCPNNGVQQNAPYCPKPSSSTGFSCGLASNIGAATWTPAKWCACRDPDNSFSTMEGDNPCAYSTPPPTPITPGPAKPATTAPPTGVPPLTDCSLVETTITGTIAPGPQTYCTCGPVMAGINTKTSDGMVYSICAGDPFPTIASSSLPPATTTAPPPKPKPSDAVIMYREDTCDDMNCYSYIHVWSIDPGEPVNPCKGGSDYLYHFKDSLNGDISVANDDSDYSIKIGPWTSHGIEMSYTGSNNHVGTLTGASLPGSPVQCIVPAAEATSCTSSHSLQADDQIPIVYCEW